MDGGRGLVASKCSMSEEQSKTYLTLCNEILEDEALKDLYGVYKVVGDAAVTLDKTMAKR